MPNQSVFVLGYNFTSDLWCALEDDAVEGMSGIAFHFYPSFSYAVSVSVKPDVEKIIQCFSHLKFAYFKCPSKFSELQIASQFFRLVATCHLHACYNLLKQLAASLWMTGFDNQLATSLLTTWVI